MSSRVAEDKSGFNYVSIPRLLVVSDLKPTVVVLPGSGGNAPNLNIFGKLDDDAARIEVIEYPGWRRYVERDFSAEALMMDLAIRIMSKVPSGPIRIVGVSIGGHFGYAVATRLQAAGREITGFARSIVSWCTLQRPRSVGNVARLHSP
jgi:surfactin synthase thioesterase subunit